MRAYEIHLNGNRLCVSGVGKHGVLLASIQYVKGGRLNKLGIEVSGLITPTKEYVTWAKRRLKVGDEVRIRIIETEATDRPETKIDLPKETIQEDPAEEIRNQKRYVREMARKFGWKLVMKRKRS